MTLSGTCGIFARANKTYKSGKTSIAQLRLGFYHSRSAALDAAPKASVDLIAAHEELIRAYLAHVAQRDNLHRSLQIDHIGPRSCNHLLDGIGRVLITMSGIVGDSGMPNEFPFVLATGQVRKRFLQGWNGKTRQQRSREVMRGVLRPVIGAGGPIATTTVTGWDARSSRPPFLPVARGEDGVYGYAFRKCYPAGYIGHLPLVVFHVPILQGLIELYPHRRRLHKMWLRFWKPGQMLQLRIRHNG